jgi:threonine/homoserine/homoserine lactone efflux protein
VIVELIGAAGLGLGLGVVTGLPLGVVNVAIVELAGRDRRAAIGVGLGGALADTAHAGLAFGGLAAAVLDRPRLAAALAIASGAILAAYAIWLVRAGRAAASSGSRTATGLARGVALGVSLTLPNPGALAAWVAVAAALRPPGMAAGLVTAAGVGVGSAAWFATLAVLAARGRADAARRPWLRTGVAALLLVIAAIAIARGAWALT